MDTDLNPRKRGQRSWTDAQRAAQARTIRTHQIWNKATGPKTELGKRIASRNSYKHGRYTFDKKVLGWYIRLAALRLRQAKAAWINQEHKFQNELIDRWNYHNPKKPRTMAFYPYFKVHPLNAPKKVRPKRARTTSDTKKIFDYLSSLSGE